MQTNMSNNLPGGGGWFYHSFKSGEKKQQLEMNSERVANKSKTIKSEHTNSIYQR